MKYKVIHPFRDLEDTGKTYPNGREYAVGDAFPATKRKVSDERIEELSGADNKIGKALIEAVEEPKKKKETSEEEGD